MSKNNYSKTIGIIKHKHEDNPAFQTANMQYNGIIAYNYVACYVTWYAMATRKARK